MKPLRIKVEPLLVLWLAAAGLLLPHGAIAGTIRHDVADAAYTGLATSYSGVGDMIIDGSTRCSGTVIKSDWVLTAAHCVDGSTSNVTFTVGGTTYAGIDWLFHSNWTGDLTAGWDIALVQLASDVTGVDIANLYTGTAELGKVGTNVGFGRSGTGLTGATVASGTKRAGNNMIDVTGTWAGWSSRILLQDFDHPDDPAESAFGSSSPLALEYLIAPGDSGGGLFIEEGGQTYLAGVHSLGAENDGAFDADYGDLAGSTRISSFVDWIFDNTREHAVPLPSALLLLMGGLLPLRILRKPCPRATPPNSKKAADRCGLQPFPFWSW